MSRNAGSVVTITFGLPLALPLAGCTSPGPVGTAAPQDAGELTASLDPHKLAAIAIVMADGLQVQWMLDPGIDLAGHIDYLLDLLNAAGAPRSPAGR